MSFIAQLLPDLSVGLGFGSVSISAVFLYLYKNERATNKKLVDNMFTIMLNNTQVMTELRDTLRGHSICPLTGTDALDVIDKLRSR
jgi:hypothetical protein